MTSKKVPNISSFCGKIIQKTFHQMWSEFIKIIHNETAMNMHMPLSLLLLSVELLVLLNGSYSYQDFIRHTLR